MGQFSIIYVQQYAHTLDIGYYVVWYQTVLCIRERWHM